MRDGPRMQTCGDAWQQPARGCTVSRRVLSIPVVDAMPSRPLADDLCGPRAAAEASMRRAPTAAQRQPAGAAGATGSDVSGSR